jgi:hypothetical protein
MGPASDPADNGKTFLEFRRKVQQAEVLSGAMEHLLGALHFSGRLSVVVENGRVLKSGYEEGYFTRRKDLRML